MASNKLGVTLNLNNDCITQDDLKTNADVCGCGENDNYMTEGRYNNGQYVSVECSSLYDGLNKGYYIVVVSSGDRAKMKQILAKVQVYYKDAYIKEAGIWIGCSH